MIEKPPNVSSLPAIQPDPLIAAVEAMRRGMGTTIEYRKLLATQYRASFLAYRKEGFTDEQSMRLVVAEIQRSYNA